MNNAKQFISLFRFQSRINPNIWWMPLVFGVPLFLPLLHRSLQNYHPGLSTLLFNQNLFFVGFLGAMVLAPEKFQFGGANVNGSLFGNEFILTRAIDRPTFYRTRAVLFYLLVLMLPCLAVLSSLKAPDLVISEYSKPIQQLAVTHLEGSSMKAPDYDRARLSLIDIPRGAVLVAEWQLWVFIAAALTLQLMVSILYPFRWAKVIFWAVFLGLIFVPILDLFNLRPDVPTLCERAFFQFGAHQLLTWILTASLFVSAQLWCEHRFAQLEQ